MSCQKFEGEEVVSDEMIKGDWQFVSAEIVRELPKENQQNFKMVQTYFRQCERDDVLHIASVDDVMVDHGDDKCVEEEARFERMYWDKVYGDEFRVGMPSGVVYQVTVVDITKRNMMLSFVSEDGKIVERWYERL